LGQEAETILESIGIICNKNMIPYDQNKPMNPSGLRIGTPAVTSRGMKEKEMEQIGGIIATALTDPTMVPELAAEVAALAKKFRIPSHY
jgi:glycine hydroxymethyltransferase